MVGSTQGNPHVHHPDGQPSHSFKDSIPKRLLKTLNSEIIYPIWDSKPRLAYPVQRYMSAEAK